MEKQQVTAHYHQGKFQWYIKYYISHVPGIYPSSVRYNLFHITFDIWPDFVLEREKMGWGLANILRASIEK